MALWQPQEVWDYAQLLVNASKSEEAAGNDPRGPIVQALKAIDAASAPILDEEMKAALADLMAQGTVNIGPPYPTP